MRFVSTLALVLAAGTFATTAPAQHAHHGQSHSPYATLAARPIKALSDEQVSDLKAGRGMGLSLPAELNGYPGPKHVLELADKLGLDAAQRQSTERLIAAMSAEAISTGTEMVALEAKLEALFADQSADDRQVRTIVDQIGAAQAGLRFIHLKYHLAIRAEMTADQIRGYAMLRGYTAGKH